MCTICPENHSAETEDTGYSHVVPIEFQYGQNIIFRKFRDCTERRRTRTIGSS